MQQLLITAVTEYHGLTGCTCHTDTRRVQIDGNELEALGLEHAGNVLADTAKSTQDHVFACSQFAGEPCVTVQQRSRWTALAEQEARNTPVVADQQRADDHAQHHRDKQRLSNVAGQNGAAPEQQSQQCHTEFAAASENDAGTHRTEIIGHEQPRDQGRDQHFPGQQDQQHR